MKQSHSRSWRPTVSFCGGSKYRYHYRKDLKSDYGEEVYGVCEHSTCSIHIDSSYPLPIVKEAVLHENLHLIAKEYYPFLVKEEIILQFGHGLFDWMRRNPETVRWILEKEVPK